jgi:hypothetical protein
MDEPFSKTTSNYFFSAFLFHKVIRRLCYHIYSQITKIFHAVSLEQKRQFGKLYFNVISSNSVNVFFFQIADYFILKFW